MSKFGTVPQEPARHTNLSECAPAFAAKVQAVLDALGRRGLDPIVYEAIRTDERQAFLYGFGRDYDDGRGIVTHAQTANQGWHKAGCAVDIISKQHGWDSRDFFDALQEEAEAEGLTSGSSWRMQDRPHVQIGDAPATPSPADQQLIAGDLIADVWQKYGVDA